MKFQNQQKGLFTFYREQQQYQEEAQHLKQQLPEPPSPLKKKKDKAYISSHTASPKHNLLHSVSLTSPEPARHNEPEPTQDEKVSFKKFGAAVMIGNRKQTEECQSNQGHAGRKDTKWKQLGTYLHNKNIDFHNLSNPYSHPSQNTFSKNKKVSSRRQEEYLRYRREERAATRLPSLGKIDQPEPLRSSTESKHKISGSLIKSTGNEIIRQILIKSEEEQPLAAQKKSVSYFEFNRDYEFEHTSKKRGVLSVEQKKLLQILNHYRRYDR